MGTRHLIAAVKGGEFKIAQYGQWDGYPEGQGVSVLAFVRDNDMAAFSAQLDKCYFGTEDEVTAAYAPYTDEQGWMTMAQSAAFKKSEFAHLSRDTGSDILSIVMNSDRDRIMLVDSHEFAADGLFCEWAYVIDMDGRKLEAYKGFKTDQVPAGQRFAGLTSVNEYSPVHLVAAWSFDELPTDEAFVAALTKRDEEVA